MVHHWPFAIVYMVWGSHLSWRIRVAVGDDAAVPAGGAAVFRWRARRCLCALRLRGCTGARPASNGFMRRIAGVLMLLGGNGLVVWAEQTVSSSVTALAGGADAGVVCAAGLGATRVVHVRRRYTLMGIAGGFWWGWSCW